MKISDRFLPVGESDRGAICFCRCMGRPMSGMGLVLYSIMPWIPRAIFTVARRLPDLTVWRPDMEILICCNGVMSMGMSCCAIFHCSSVI